MENQTENIDNSLGDTQRRKMFDKMIWISCTVPKMEQQYGRIIRGNSHTPLIQENTKENQKIIKYINHFANSFFMNDNS